MMLSRVILAVTSLALCHTAKAEYGFLISHWNSGRLCMTATKSSKIRLARCSTVSPPPENQLWKMSGDGRLVSKLDPTMCAIARELNKIVRLAPCHDYPITMDNDDDRSNFKLYWNSTENCLAKRGEKRYIVTQPCGDDKMFQWKMVSASAERMKEAWLQAHNKRRIELHKAYGRSPVTLKWSRELAESAQRYSELLLHGFGKDVCHIEHGFKGNRYGGENLAWQITSGSAVSPESVMKQWFENEANQPYPRNGHYTQIAWRATKYVGCGYAKKTLSSGYTCHIQTCRYLKPGNCNVGHDWMTGVLAADSPCGPSCPVKEGCI